MKNILSILFAILMVVSMAGIAGAIPQTVNFSDYPDYTPTQDNLDADASAWFYTNYGITFDQLYMYTDSRDTFDGLGISIGWVEDIPSQNTGTIFFADTTDYVTIDWWTIDYNNQISTYSIYNASDVLLDSFTVGGGTEGTSSLYGTSIAYMTLNGYSGFTQISTLSYDYDGFTDGKNDDVTVPEPATLVLFGTGLLGLVGASRKKLKK